MKRLRNHLLGIEQGEIMLFSDFREGGEMWTGDGPRERRRIIAFSEPFRSPPAVLTNVSLWDVDTQSAVRVDLGAENVTRESFELVLRTWGDSRIARARIAWTALGEVAGDDDWDVI